jgi:hypothetical protein
MGLDERLKFNPEEVAKRAKYLIEISKELKENPSPEKSGGYLTLVIDGFDDFTSLRVGEKIPAEKLVKYEIFSQEKAHRVYAHWLRKFPFEKSLQIVSSYQSRNPKEEKWGGAVLFNKEVKDYEPDIVSFSGLSEFADEALSYIIGYCLGFQKNDGLLEKIKEVSKNPMVDEMFSRFNEKFQKS